MAGSGLVAVSSSPLQRDWRLGHRFAPWPVSAAGTLLGKIEATDLELKVKSSKAAPDSSKVGRYSRHTAEALSALPTIAAQGAAVKGRVGTDNDPESQTTQHPLHPQRPLRPIAGVYPNPTGTRGLDSSKVVGLDSTLVQHRSQIRSGCIRSEHRTAPAAAIGFGAPQKEVPHRSWDPGPSTPATWSGHSRTAGPIVALEVTRARARPGL